MKPSKRLERIPPYAFAQLERKIAEKRAAGRRRDQPRHRRPRPADAAADRGGDAGGGQRARDAPLPHQPRPRGLPRGAVRDFYERRFDVKLDPDERDHPGDRRQGGDLQPQPRVPRPRRLRARGRPRLPGLHRRTVARRRRAGADGAAAGARLRARPRRDRRGRRASREADVPQLPEQPDRRDRAGGLLRARRRVRARLRDPRRARQRLLGDRLRRLPRARRSCRRPAPRTSASRCSRCPRATT